MKARTPTRTRARVLSARLAEVAVVTWALFPAPAPALAQGVDRDAVQAAAEVQESPTLDRAEAWSRVGRVDQARATLLAWWNESYARASRRDVQRALWLRGRLTVDPAQAELDFRRLVIEYPSGPYSAQALLRLAQAAYAAGDSAVAASQIARLSQEYPGSAARREADEWMAAAGPLPEPLSAEAEAVSGTAPGENAQRENAQGESAQGSNDRGGADEASEAVNRAAAPGDAPQAVAPAERPLSGGGRWSVQAGAFSNEGRATALGTRLRDAGLEPRIVHVEGSRLLHVRVGKFASSAEAGVILDRLRELGFTVAMVRDADREELEPR